MKSKEFISLEEVRKLLRRVERSEKRGAEDYLRKRVITHTIFRVSTQLSDLAVFSFEPTLNKLVKLKK